MTQRKGLADLFAAMKLLKRQDVELLVMGSPIAPMEFYRRQYPDFTYMSTRPHREVLELMQSCDVLVLPSMSRGARWCSRRRWPTACRSSSRKTRAART